MRADRALVSALLGLALLAAVSPAGAQETPPPAAVPGPQRPVADTPAPPPTATPDNRRLKATAAPEPTRPAPRVEAPPAPPPELLEGAFRPGATGEKAAGRALARPAAKELKLEKLAVTAGRDLELWLVARDRIGNGEDLGDSKHVSLGRLKKPEGDQTYRLPPEVDLRVYRAVVVWSRRERSARAAAMLVPQAVQKQKPAKSKKARDR